MRRWQIYSLPDHMAGQTERAPMEGFIVEAETAEEACWRVAIEHGPKYGSVSGYRSWIMAELTS